MGFWNAILQGIIQGLTEFLPVSSSGHVSIYQHIAGISGDGSQSFTLLLHFGTLIAVFVVYRELIWNLILEFFSMVKDLVKGKFLWKLKDMNQNRTMVIMVFVASAWAVLLFVPMFGFLELNTADGEAVKNMADLSTYFSEDAGIMAEGIFLLMTGALLLYATRLSKLRDGKPYLTYRNATAMGISQCFAAMPGLSRSGTTTTMGMISGVEKNTALNFSFIMSIPAILAANVVDLKDIGEMGMNFTAVEAIFGIIVAGVVGVLAIGGLKWIVKNNKLDYFGYYCLAAGLIVVVIGIVEHSTGSNIFTKAALENVSVGVIG
ncbi:MAG: undecaprenyl-diphosphate phosphatase [Oscillospiraceae bacterium]|jgi:undecaprenyl-diphosphatase|nr:undecaprenyl-diphosphate phosphatase [Oscillospiraceae bacterium]